jgi:hypothetical protein
MVAGSILGHVAGNHRLIFTDNKLLPSPILASKEAETTVGAQSIAPAQSIAHGQIGDSIIIKNEIFQKLFLTKDKKW